MRHIIMLLIPLFAACAAKPVAETPPMSALDRDLVRVFAASSQDIRSSLRVLAETQNARALTYMSPAEMAQAEWQSGYVPEGLEKVVTFSGAVPVLPTVEMISEFAGWNPPRVMGQKPIPDLVVDLRVKDAKAVDVLRDIGTQMGEAGEVVLYPATKIIEVRYHAHNKGVRQ
jgi:defect in organelle trafficking protein DotD